MVVVVVVMMNPGSCGHPVRKKTVRVHDCVLPTPWGLCGLCCCKMHCVCGGILDRWVNGVVSWQKPSFSSLCDMCSGVYACVTLPLCTQIQRQRGWGYIVGWGHSS